MEASFLQEDQLQNGLEVEGTVRTSMESLAQWTRINAAIGFVGLVLSLMSSFIAYSRMSAFNSSTGLVLLVTGIISSILTLIINLSLYNFSRQLKLAMANENQEALDKAAVHIKNYFMLFMVMIIVVVLLAFISGIMTTNALR